MTAIASRSSGERAYQRNSASCTASSASASEPSSRYATLISLLRWLIASRIPESDSDWLVMLPRSVGLVLVTPMTTYCHEM